MDKFTSLTTGAVALEADNIDTDQIMPKQFLRGIDKSGLDKGLFYNLKHKADGSLDPKCVLNSPARLRPPYSWPVPNFGCGSSREQRRLGDFCKVVSEWLWRRASERSSTAIVSTTAFWRAKFRSTIWKSFLMSCARILKLFLLLISLHGRFVPATWLSALRLHRVTAAC